MSVFVITHKEIEMPSVRGYRPLLVGAINRDEILRSKYLRDDDGENISKYNDSYCEMTGLYWIWKNCKDDYVGLVHYRRFFAKVKCVCKLKSRYVLAGDEKKCIKIYTEEELRGLLSDCEIIVKKSSIYRRGNKHIFNSVLGSRNMSLFKNVLREYDGACYNQFIENEDKRYHVNCNMFYASKSLIDKYCTWLFPFLRKLDEYQISGGSSRFMSREIGYFAEIVFGAWLDANKVNYKYVDAITTGTNDAEAACMRLSEVPYIVRKYIKRGM